MRASLLPVVTQDDVEQLVEPILHRHKDLTLVGRHLVVKPVGHVLRFIRLGHHIFDDLFNVGAVVDLTFLRYSSWATNGERPLYNNGWGPWNIFDPEEVERLRYIIEETTLPELRRVNTIDDFLAYRSNKLPPYSFSFDFNVMACIAITKGDFDEALCIVEAAIAKGWVDHLPTYYELLKKRDRGAVITFLRKQQASSIATLGLTDYWKPTPFPLEL
jgi:hypothetical protein